MMAELFKTPSIVKAAGNKPKEIREYFGHVNSKSEEISIAYMISPGGWKEPAQTPDFNEYTLVLKGILRVETKENTLEVKAGQAVLVRKGEWVHYSTPYKSGAEYIAVCLPAFSADIVNRDSE